jgi:LysR family transcriptional regulator, glycine cleavage system transcriptional activator
LLPLPLHAFRVFEAVARLGHVGAAAAELHITPGAVSQQIRNVQRTLGIELFEKRGRRLALTEKGAMLQRSVATAMQGITEGVRQIQVDSQAAPIQTTLTISIPLNFGISWLATRLFAFMVANKHLKLHVLTTRPQNSVDWRRADVAVVYGNPPWPGFWSRMLHDVNITPVCSPQLLRGPHAIRTPADIAHHRLLHEDDGEQWRQWLLAAGVPYPGDTDVYFDDFGIVLQAARDGFGVALSDETTSSRDLDEGRLVQPIPFGIRSARDYHCLCREESLANPQIVGFIEWLVSQTGISAGQ